MVATQATLGTGMAGQRAVMVSLTTEWESWNGGHGQGCCGPRLTQKLSKLRPDCTLYRKPRLWVLQIDYWSLGMGLYERRVEDLATGMNG
jgi:hypothetical protein